MKNESERIKENTEKRKVGFFDTVFMSVVLMILIILAGDAFLGTPIKKLTAGISGESGEWSTFFLYFTTICEWIACVLFMLISRKDRAALSKTVPGNGGNTLKFALIGLAAGFAMNAVCVLAALLNGDIYLNFEGGRVFMFLLTLAAVFIQSGSEELICRVFFYQRVLRAYNRPWLAVAVTSVIFSLMHVFNPGLTVLALVTIFACGILFALIIYYFDSFFMAAFLHTAWNYTQNIIFGLPNSGRVVPMSVFKLDASAARNSLFYNVGFGIEGTVMALAVQAAAIAAVILTGRNKRKKEKENLNKEEELP